MAAQQATLRSRASWLPLAAALLAQLALPASVGASVRPGNGAEVITELIRREECNDSGSCLEQRQVFHRVETPSGVERATTNGSFSQAAAPAGGAFSVSTRHHLQEMTREGQLHELRDRQQTVQASGGTTCELRVARHEANGSTQYDTVTECVPS